MERHTQHEEQKEWRETQKKLEAAEGRKQTHTGTRHTLLTRAVANELTGTGRGGYHGLSHTHRLCNEETLGRRFQAREEPASALW